LRIHDNREIVQRCRHSDDHDQVSKYHPAAIFRQLENQKL
jgi:hypothetical protein